MLPKISEEDLIFFQVLRHPIMCSEVFFHDLDNLGSFDSEKFGEVRKYQYPFLAYDSLFFENSELSKKENFAIKKGFAESYVMGGRLTGKSIISIILDCLIATFNKTYNWGVVSSLDFDHIKNVMEKIIIGFENHPVLKLLNTHKHTQRNPYKIVANNGCLLESVNDNLVGKNPGQHWYSKHVDKNWVEEASFMTKQVTNKRLMAQSELGCIDRCSGMTTFPKISPMGEIFYNLKNESKIVNLPSYVNPSWDEIKDDAAILEFGGKNSVGYQVQIMGKVVENGDAVYDIDRIRETYKKEVPIKAFEINKNNFYNYKERLIIERPNNAESSIVALDKGEGAAPSEIIVLFKINNIYRYEYNITTFKLAPDEDEAVIDYIINAVRANVIGIDATSGGGKALYCNLSKKYKENCVAVCFNEKIDVDFAKDEKGNMIVDKAGNIQYESQTITEWSVHCLKQLFYNKKIQCLMDYKLDQQFDGVVVMKSDTRTIYGYKTENHLFQAFQVFAICHWKTEFLNLHPSQRRKPGF